MKELAMTIRSYLFAPANHPRRAEKVFNVGADAIILDLEDSVAISEKVTARQAAVSALKGKKNCHAYVRINDFSTDFCFGDLSSVIVGGLDGVVLPKVESVSQVIAVSWMITALEKERDLTPNSIQIMPILETARGITSAAAIAKAGLRVKKVCFGAADYAQDLNLQLTPDEGELTSARDNIVLASRVAGIEPPVDSVWLEINDGNGLQSSAARVRNMGFQGKLAIHPSQIPIINNVFTPSKEEVEFANKIVTAFEKAEASGSASIQVDGHFVDYPIYERALRTIATSET